jgi:hypothetical protein
MPPAHPVAKSLENMLQRQSHLAKHSAPLIQAQRKSNPMNSRAANPEFDLRHPVLTRYGKWPVVCFAISAVFLYTVYLLGNFSHRGVQKSSSEKLELKAPASVLQASVQSH